MLIDFDHEAKFWMSPPYSLIDASGIFVDLNTCNPWRASTPWVIQAGNYRRGLQGRGGSNQFLFVPAIGIPSRSFTVEFWIYSAVAWSAVTNGVYPLSFGGPDSGFIRVVTDTGVGGPRLDVRSADGSTYGLHGPALGSGWHHLAFTYDGTNIRFYVDGTETTGGGNSPTAFTAPLTWTAANKESSGLMLLSDQDHGVGIGTNWVISDIRVSRICRAPATPVTVATANTVTITDTPTGATTNTRLRGGLHDCGSNSTTLGVMDTLGITLARVDKLDSAVPVKAGGTDGTHPTAGHSGSYSYDFRPVDHLFTYLQARGMAAYLGFGSCPQLLGGSVAPLNSTDCADPTVLGGNSTAWAPEVPTNTANNATICADIYYYARNTYPAVPIQYVGYGNEPHSSFFWSGTKTQLYDNYKAVVNAIRVINGSQSVGGVEVTDWGSNKTWVQDHITYCGANSVPLSYVSVHLYTGDLNLIATIKAAVAAWAAAAGISTPPIVVGEFGWYTLPYSNEFPWHSSTYWINDFGASFLAAALMIHQAAGTEAFVFTSLNTATSIAVGEAGLGLIDASKPWANGNVERMWSMIG
jgi:hypothetical protein